MSAVVELGGWRYRGDLLPPGAVPTKGDATADISVTVTSVPIMAEEAEPGHPLWRRLADGRVLLSVPGIGRFCLSGGTQVDIEPAAGADPITLGLLLSGPVLAVLQRQRGFIPFDGAALGLNGKALLIVGASGLGKSSLAAALAQQGWPVLADGVLAVACAGAGPELVRGAPHLRLWRRTAQALGLDLEGCVPLRPGVARFHTRWGDGSPGPWAISGVVNVLNRTPAPGVERLSAARATACLAQSVWSRPAYGEDRTGAAALMADIISLASRIPCWHLTLCEHLDGLTATSNLLQDAIQRYSDQLSPR